MSKMFQTVLVMPLLVATLATDAAAEFTLPPPPPTLTLEDIKAARDKFDREMKLDTKRPWDGTGWKTPSIDLSPPDKPKTD
jgi:hypothetical protein